MDALNLDPKALSIKQLHASEFPEPADVYVCDKCGRDITSHLVAVARTFDSLLALRGTSVLAAKAILQALPNGMT